MIASNSCSDRNELEFGHMKANWTLFCVFCFGRISLSRPRCPWCMLFYTNIRVKVLVLLMTDVSEQLQMFQMLLAGLRSWSGINKRSFSVTNIQKLSLTAIVTNSRSSASRSRGHHYGPHNLCYKHTKFKTWM